MKEQHNQPTRPHPWSFYNCVISTRSKSGLHASSPTDGSPKTHYEASKMEIALILSQATTAKPLGLDGFFHNCCTKCSSIQISGSRNEGYVCDACESKKPFTGERKDIAHITQSTLF